ncbi:TetR/AcrR family transcriptional regulator [Lentzea tibetensis]|uniref:TetR/AcrR family transcriptional regulator n=1 Tax=Lentzea tibetensis TaxID=2591470 RepID=UPI001C9A09AC|nr:TetR/AcrR family transcriptional regulator [Lentzea tibetensis]
MTRAPHLPLAQRRELVLDAALRVMSRTDGPLSVDAVAAEAGVAKTVLYRCFVNRDDMVAALEQRESRRLTDELEAALRAADSPDRVEAMGQFLQTYFTGVTNAPDSYRLIYDRPSPRASRLLQEARATVARHLAPLFNGDGTSAALFVGVVEAGARLVLEGERPHERAVALFAALTEESSS